MEQFRCSKCKQEFPRENFYSSPKRKNGLSHYCKPCARAASRSTREKNPEKAREAYSAWAEKNKPLRAAYARKWRAENPEADKAHDRKYRYGLSDEEYQKKLEEQGGVCAICGGVNTRKDKNGDPYFLAVDHSHETNQIRDLLCSACNTALGQYERHAKAMHNYLLKWGVIH